MSRVEVPITDAVLRWAIQESGLSVSDVAHSAQVEESAIAGWLAGQSRPTLTQMRAVAGKLHRQLAVFLLPAPPLQNAVAVQFRHPIEQPARELSAAERRYLRRARRLQEAEAWLSGELGRAPVRLPPADIGRPATEVAGEIRSRLQIDLDHQRGWRSASHAFDEWRAAVEALGVSVLLFPLGAESCRGFSLWDDRAPVIAVNTAWRDEARIFTLFHELGHLLTRTSSACSAVITTSDSQDPAERWCESFAAAVLLPREALYGESHVADLRTLARIANRHKLSLRATALRLIELGKATWPLFRLIPAASDSKRGGGGGGGRNRREIREDEVGQKALGIFVEAVNREVIVSSQALDYLDIRAADFDHIVSTGTY